ncbi:MAG: acylphosphatase [Wenzhouxiangella sp.]
MAECRRWLISGRVQGVFFRESTRRQAERLGLSGYAVNRKDGRVEVAARGDGPKLEQLERWLQEGPADARVEEVMQTTKGQFEVPEAGVFRTG